MKRNGELGRLLREADPATRRELPPVDRARMRAVITGAALRGQRRRSPVRWIALGAALTAVAIACVALIPGGDHDSAKLAAPPADDAPSRPARPAPVVTETPEPALAKLPAHATWAHEHPHLARLDDRRRVTRIVFTAPEGTRILWFVGTPDAKELGS